MNFPWSKPKPSVIYDTTPSEPWLFCSLCGKSMRWQCYVGHYDRFTGAPQMVHVRRCPDWTPPTGDEPRVYGDTAHLWLYQSATAHDQQRFPWPSVVPEHEIDS